MYNNTTILSVYCCIVVVGLMMSWPCLENDKFVVTPGLEAEAHINPTQVVHSTELAFSFDGENTIFKIDRKSFFGRSTIDSGWAFLQLVCAPNE